MALLLKLKTSVLRRFSLVDGFDISRQIPWSKASVFFSTASADQSEDELKAKYEKYLVKYGKVYKTPEDKELHFKIFKRTLKLKEYYGAHPYLSYHADLTQEESRRMLNSCLANSIPHPGDRAKTIDKEREAQQHLENRLKQMESELEEVRAQQETFKTQLKKLVEKINLPQ